MTNKNGIVESFDRSRGEGLIWTADRLVKFFSVEPWADGTLVVFEETLVATNVRKNTAASPISSAYDVRSDAALDPGYKTLNGEIVPFSENPQAFTQHGDREAAEAQKKPVPSIDCGTFSEDLSKSPSRLLWGKD